MSDKKADQCGARVRRGSGRRATYGQCIKRGTVERNGKWYCGQHDPQAVEDRRQKAKSRFNADMQENVRRQRLAAAAPDLLEALKYVMSAHGEQLHDAFDMAHRAITKAEGSRT